MSEHLSDKAQWFRYQSLPIRFVLQKNNSDIKNSIFELLMKKTSLNYHIFDFQFQFQFLVSISTVPTIL